MALDENIAAQDEHQVFRGSSLAKNKVSVFTKPLRSMGREPGKLLLGQSLQVFDRAQGCNNIRNGPGLVRTFHLCRHKVACQVHYRRLVPSISLAIFYGY